MPTRFDTITRPRSIRRGAAIGLTLVLAAVAGCKVLDVDNPNNVIDESLNTATSATPLATGVVGIVTRALSAMNETYATATDELDWVGSLDGFNQIDIGNVSNQVITQSDASYQRAAEARWFGDDAIRRIKIFDDSSRLANRNDLTTAYLYAAIMYISIADQFDDFPQRSTNPTGGPAIGEGKMSEMYDTAVVYLDRGLAIATATNNAALRTQILAVRARAKYSKVVWSLVNPPVRINGAAAPVANPLVNDAGANADAVAALALMGTGDYTLSVTPTTTGTAGNNIGSDLNNRREQRIGSVYATPDPAAQGLNRTLLVNGQPAIVLNDPVTGQPDVALRARVNAAINGGQYLTYIIVSAREMNLILAEAAAATGNTAELTSRINAVRTLAGQTPYSGTGVAPIDLISHSRRVNLFLQGRRLSDMYRFGQRDVRWQQTTPAYLFRGCFFPIGITERNSNPLITAVPICQAG